jgi:hypothetical protein
MLALLKAYSATDESTAAETLKRKTDLYITHRRVEQAFPVPLNLATASPTLGGPELQLLISSARRSLRGGC